MKSVVFLGTSAATPTRHLSVSAHALHFLNGRSWLVDCGEGTQHQIVKCDDIKANRIDVIFITHLHGDHCFGLPGLLATLSLVGGDREKPLHLFGPAGLREFINTAIGVSQTYLTYKLEVVELEPEKVHDLGEIDGYKISAFPLRHKVPCFGYIVTEPDKPAALDARKASSLGAKGKDMGLLKAGKDVTLADGSVIKASDVLGVPQKGRKAVMLGDTCDSSSLMEAAMHCDVLVHEATYDATLEGKAIEGGHSTSAMAGKFAQTLNAKKMILTHFSMRYTTAKEGELGVDDLLKEAQNECPHTTVLAADDFAVFDI